MDTIVQTTSHPGLRAWFELLRTERRGLMPKYWVDRRQDIVQCLYPGCGSLTIRTLSSRNWSLRQRRGPGYLFASRHQGVCPWHRRVGSASQNSFTTQPLERAYIYWAQFEHKLTHK